MKKTDDEINDNLQAAIIYIPKDAIALDITVKLLDTEDYSVYECHQVMDIATVKDAIIDGEYWEAENVKYVLNPDYAKENSNGKSDT